jgi:hypothetical protein
MTAWPETVAIITAVLTVGGLFATGFLTINKRIDDLRDDMNTRFTMLIAEMNRRFDAIDGRLGRLETRFDELRAQLERVRP